MTVIFACGYQKLGVYSNIAVVYICERKIIYPVSFIMAETRRNQALLSFPHSLRLRYTTAALCQPRNV